MSVWKPSFRNGFFAGLLIAGALAFYLFQLWDSAQQIRLHSAHLLAAIEQKNWSKVENFIDLNYADQWGQDRAMVMTRMRGVLPHAHNLRIQPREVIVRAADGEGEWRGRVTLEADPNEVSEMIKARVNALDEPFVLKWRHRSRKPWDWALVRVSNSTLELPSGNF